MRHRSADLESLPPLDVRPRRQLDLGAPTHHVAAASGVARRGDFVYVIGDDLLELGVFRLTDPGPGALRRALADEGTDLKADLEALTVLPPFEEHPFGALLGLGSGSGERRDRGFVWPLASDGSLRDDPREISLEPVYTLLRDQLGELNIEGASVVEDRLWLLQRGNTDSGLNVVAELSLPEVLTSLRRDLCVEAEELADVRSYDLGELDGVPLTFSDATPLGRDLLIFTASAEADDHAIHGSVVGTLDPSGEVHRLRTIDRRYKVEGVYASIDTGVVDFLFVCDQDDPDEGSPLLAATMPLDARFEAR